MAKRIRAASLHSMGQTQYKPCVESLIINILLKRQITNYLLFQIKHYALEKVFSFLDAFVGSDIRGFVVEQDDEQIFLACFLSVLAGGCGVLLPKS